MSCAWCEQEFNTPNISLGHGMCARHYKDFVGQDMPNISNRFDPDLKNLSPEERTLASNIVGIQKMKHPMKHPLGL